MLVYLRVTYPDESTKGIDLKVASFKVKDVSLLSGDDYTRITTIELVGVKDKVKKVIEGGEIRKIHLSNKDTGRTMFSMTGTFEFSLGATKIKIDGTGDVLTFVKEK